MYEMKIDLRVLDHLGIKLYSNAAAVLSEAVANAWDADANNVSVDINSTSIVIEDDGVGMNLQSINKRFLFVGYDKRKTEGSKSASGRDFMGRKGIGKLSLFSIADHVEIHTNSGHDPHAFSMDVSDIEVAISNDAVYKPKPIPFNGPAKGTRIVLTSLKKRGSGQTLAALRKRVARRFSVIGYETALGDSFNVKIGGALITPSDREDLQNIEFIWQFGDNNIKISSFPKIRKSIPLSGEVSESNPGWRVRGWLGTAVKPRDLKTVDSGAINGIIVVARGRLIQENILDKLSFHMILGNYVTGQIEADFLDIDSEPDIATSDRQRVIEDDPRYIALLAFLRRSLISIADEWADMRNEARGKEVQAEIPALKNWIDKLPTGQQTAARSMLGLIQGVELEDDSDRRSLYKAGVIAFERLRLQEASTQLGNLRELTAAKIMPLLIDMSSLEGSLYRDIVAERLEIIKTFTNLVDENEKENLLRDYLFSHMWLLDPGWERATESPRMEQTLKKEYREFASDLTDEQSKGRVDIRYRTNAQQHILVELKRAKRVLSIWELAEQGSKYRDTLEKCLRLQNGVDYTPNISVVFVVGREITGGDAERVAKTLATFNGRVVYYEQLIQSARSAYSLFLDSSDKANSIDNLLKTLSL
ncbi:ATP-binding protein [Acidovorax sp. sic0104]|uniref:BbrUII/HgiDII family restriction enzyme n=1 Tax=Acidovorax sp. sic0104 TaxID=2854784 RepID=UPI001C49096F|nr:ATP-binding protein [Acidovorax sp. sic0104]MBV7542838.1 ATP-binding protein [Acidovorax sp. sic0104]